MLCCKMRENAEFQHYSCLTPFRNSFIVSDLSLPPTVSSTHEYLTQCAMGWDEPVAVNPQEPF